MPNNPAMRPCAIAMPWLGVSIESVSPSHAATIACGSIALWYCGGVSKVASMRFDAAESPASTSPRSITEGLPMPTAGGTKLSFESSPTRAGSMSYFGASSAAPSVAASSVSAITTAIAWLA